MRFSKLTLLASFAALAALAAFSQTAQAAPITYTFTSIATGTLNSVSYTNIPLSFTLVGDTSTLSFPFGAGIPVVQTTGGGVLGSTSFSFTDTTHFFNNQSARVAGFSLSSSGLDIFDVGSPAFAAWNGISALGPIETSFFFGDTVNTTAGVLTISNALSPTFRAAVTSSAPEPASLALLALGGAALVKRRRK